MPKTKNDPGKYVKRSALVPRPKDDGVAPRLRPSAKREREYMTAPIDGNMYIDFRPAARRRSGGS